MRRRGLTRRATLLLALFAVALIGLAVILISGWASPAEQRSPQVSADLSGGPSPSASSPPSSSGQALSGADLGKRVEFHSGDAAGWVTITSAEWTDSGEAEPPAGSRYLIISVTIECSQGSLVVDPNWLRATTGSQWTGPGYGPSLASPLSHHLISAGQQASGQVGFVLPAGAAKIGLLDQELADLAELQLSAP